MKHIGFALGFAAMTLTGQATSEAAAAKVTAVGCTADSGKAFAPALTPQQICDRFTRALGSKASELRVELHFSKLGLASAKAAQRRNGKWVDLPLFELAVMDRRFNASDVERLAKDVLRGMNSAAAP
jgi:hypothetical protein